MNKRSAPAATVKGPMEPKRYYVRQAFEPWSTFEAVSVFGNMTLPPIVAGSQGVLRAFSTLKAFAAECPDEEPIVVVVVPRDDALKAPSVGDGSKSDTASFNPKP